MTKIIFSAMRPTGRLHLGHLVGALDNWLKLQKEYRCVFSIVDWHALMGEYANSQAISEHILEMAIDWMACGIDPEQSILFVQSQVPEHLELQMILSCLTPLGWLERNPTYKEQLREITTRDLQTYGFLGYPVLQAADILLYKASAVPIGEDQMPHLELTREIARRFNHIFHTDFFADCEAILTKTPRLPGLDGRKMSKSYQNAVYLSDRPETIQKKIQGMFTDPKRVRLKDPGHPDECHVFAYYRVFASERVSEVRDWCTKAQKGCTACKRQLAEILRVTLEPLQARRRELEDNKDTVGDILREGRQKASAMARDTMNAVKDIVFGASRCV